MKRNALITGALLVLVAFAVGAQDVTFANLTGTVGSGDWGMIMGGYLLQSDADAPLARIDFPIPDEVKQAGVYRVRFNVRYEGGGAASLQDMARLHLHAGFGVHIGVTNPALGKAAWGNGESVLLWLNLDTRPSTPEEHFGFRAQVYQSTANARMELATADALAPTQQALLEDVYGLDTLSIDIVEALGLPPTMMVDFLTAVDETYTNVFRPAERKSVPIDILVDAVHGRVTIQDPTNDRVSFYFDFADPDILMGDYISLRTNDLAARFVGVDGFVASPVAE